MMLLRVHKQTSALAEETVRYKIQLMIKYRVQNCFDCFESNQHLCIESPEGQCVSGLPDKASPVLLSRRIRGQHQCQVFSCVERGSRVVVVAVRPHSVR